MTQASRVESLSAADASRLAEIHASSFADHWPADAFEALLGRPQVAALGALVNGSPSLQGFVLIQIIADEAEILTFCVQPGCRQLGLGRALLKSSFDLARTRGAARVFLEVGEDNLAARALYESEGFALVGRRAAYYHGSQADRVGADALVLRKPLE